MVESEEFLLTTSRVVGCRRVGALVVAMAVFLTGCCVAGGVGAFLGGGEAFRMAEPVDLDAFVDGAEGALAV